MYLLKRLLILTILLPLLHSSTFLSEKENSMITKQFKQIDIEEKEILDLFLEVKNRRKAKAEELMKLEIERRLFAEEEQKQRESKIEIERLKREKQAQLDQQIQMDIEAFKKLELEQNKSLNAMLKTPKNVVLKDINDLKEENNELNKSNTAQIVLKNSIDKKIIFLTFDDGPLAGTTNILKVLQKEKVPATMFMVAKHILMNKKIYKKALKNPYVTVANHTYSHANGRYRKFYSNSKKLSKDIKHSDKILSKDKNATGISCFHPLRLAGRNVFRLPGINCNDHGLGKKQCAKEKSKYDALEKEGFCIYGWDLEWHFNPRNGKPIGSAKKIVRNLENIYAKKRYKQKDKVILLMHDFMFRKRHKGEKKLLTLIHLLKKNGWTFAHLKDYI